MAPVTPGPQKTEVVDHILSKEMMRVFLEDNWRLIHRIPKMIPVMALTVVWNVEYGRR